MDLLEYYRNFPFGAFFWPIFRGELLAVSWRGLFNGYFTVFFLAGVKSTIPESVTKITMLKQTNISQFSWCTSLGLRKMCTVPLAAAAMRCLVSAAKAGDFSRRGQMAGLVKHLGSGALNGPETGMPASGKWKRFKLFVGCPPNLKKIVIHHMSFWC